MARPKQIDRTVEKNLCIPVRLVEAVDAHLTCPVEGKVPFGAWKKLVTGLLEEWLGKVGTADGSPDSEELLQVLKGDFHGN